MQNDDLRQAIRLAEAEDKKPPLTSRIKMPTRPRKDEVEAYPGEDDLYRAMRLAETENFPSAPPSALKGALLESELERCARLAETEERHEEIGLLELRQELNRYRHDERKLLTELSKKEERVDWEYPVGKVMGAMEVVMVPVLISRAKRKKGTLHVERMGKAILM